MGEFSRLDLCDCLVETGQPNLNHYTLVCTVIVMNNAFFPSMIISQKMTLFANTVIVQCGVL